MDRYQLNDYYGVPPGYAPCDCCGNLCEWEQTCCDYCQEFTCDNCGDVRGSVTKSRFCDNCLDKYVIECPNKECNAFFDLEIFRDECELVAPPPFEQRLCSCCGTLLTVCPDEIESERMFEYYRTSLLKTPVNFNKTVEELGRSVEAAFAAMEYDVEKSK